MDYGLWIMDYGLWIMDYNEIKFIIEIVKIKVIYYLTKTSDIIK